MTKFELTIAVSLGLLIGLTLGMSVSIFNSIRDHVQQEDGENMIQALMHVSEDCKTYSDVSLMIGDPKTIRGGFKINCKDIHNEKTSS